MSLQRILELARRQRFPLIVTDLAGREPMVVLGLEAYERLIEKQPAIDLFQSVPVQTTKEQTQHSQLETEKIIQVVDFSPTQKEVLPLASTLFSEPVEPNSELALGVEEGELAMEERFYLEPLD